MANFSFKSSGIKFDDRRVQNDEITLNEVPIGIKTPLSFDSKSQSGLFDMHFDSLSQVKDNLKNLVMTERGERLGRGDYGCNLLAFTFDYSMVGEFEKNISNEINSQVQKFLPFVQIKNISFLNYFSKNKNINNELSDSGGLSAILIGISYDVPKIGAVNQILETVLFVGG